MAHRIKDSFKLALAQLDAVVGDIDGNLRQSARGARARGASRRRPDRLYRAVSHRLPDRGPGAEAGLAESGAGGAGVACTRHQGWRAGRADGPAVRRWTVRLQRSSAAGSRPHRGAPLQEQPAELWRVRREAGVRSGADAGADRLSRDQARRSGLRGYLERASVQGAGCRRARNCSSCPTDRPIGSTSRMCVTALPRRA